MPTEHSDILVDVRTHQRATDEGFRCDDQTLEQQHISIITSLRVP